MWDTINVPASTYTLTNGSPGEVEDNSNTGDLDINDQLALTIRGAGARKTIIDGNGWDRIFDVHSGPGAPDGWAEIYDLTITNGKRPTYVNGDLSDGSSGGGVRNGPDSSLALIRVAVTNNTADHSCSGCIGGGGGGISNEFDGKLQLTDSTVSGNTVHSLNGGGGILSGPFPLIGVENKTETTIVNSTISGNSSLDTDDDHGAGGGIATESGLTRIWNSTITNNNTAPGRGSGVDGYYDSTEVHSTIISKNANNDDVHSSKPSFASPAFFSAGHNLIGGGNASSAFNAEGDQTGVTDPHIGPLQNNGVYQHPRATEGQPRPRRRPAKHHRMRRGDHGGPAGSQEAAGQEVRHRSLREEGKTPLIQRVGAYSSVLQLEPEPLLATPRGASLYLIRAPKGAFSRQ